MQTIQAMGTAEMLKMREDTTDELIRRLEGHLEDYLGDRDWCEETGDPFAIEEVANEIIDREAWQGAGEYAFFTFETHWPSQTLLFTWTVDTPEWLAELLYLACKWAHSEGIDFARAGRNVGCNKLSAK